MAMNAEPIIQVLFGSQWSHSVEPSRFFMAAAAFGALGAFSGHALNAIGAPGIALRLAVIQLAVKVVAVFAGASFGLTGVAIAVAFATLVSTLITLVTLKRKLQLMLSQWARAGRSSLLLALLVNIGPAAVLQAGLSQMVPAVIELCVGAVAWTASFVAAAFLLRHPIAAELARLAKSSRTQGRRSS